MKTVLITGGSSGIGQAVALQASQKGWHVLVGYDQGQERAQRIVDAFHTAGGKADAVHLPLKDPARMDQSLSLLSTSGRTIHALVLSASPRPVLASFLKTKSEEFLDQFIVNVVGHHHLLMEVWKRFFRNQGEGHVIALLSAAVGAPPWPHMTAYVTAKRALQGMIECALSELSGNGLRATLVSPDYTETPMLLNVEPRILEAARAKRPAGKFLSPKEVGAAIAHHLENPPSPGVSPEWLTIEPSR